MRTDDNNTGVYKALVAVIAEYKSVPLCTLKRIRTLDPEEWVKEERAGWTSNLQTRQAGRQALL